MLQEGLTCLCVSYGCRVDICGICIRAVVTTCEVFGSTREVLTTALLVALMIRCSTSNDSRGAGSHSV